MDASYYEKYEPIFGAWHITKRIGEGGYGKVFEIEREEFGTVYKAALKAITVPANESELLEVQSDGLDDESVRTYFGSCVKELTKEFALMSELKGNSNIVSYEDHQVIEHEDGVGWDILIRMELLTPLNAYIKNLKDNEQGMSRGTIIQLGIDLCRALELCQKHNIIHRDIKPENIFISADGNFKLGDFGIARTVEKTSSSLSKKGTEAYMAPEVYKGEPYDTTVDIYSLGIVLYRLLNGGKTPFLSPSSLSITMEDKDKALRKRISGAPIPPPINADERLAEIVLKACAYEPKERYSSPTQMRKCLEAALSRKAASEEPSITPPQTDNPQGDDGKTRSEKKNKKFRSDPTPPTPPEPPKPVVDDPTPPAPPKQKSNAKLLILGIAAAAVVLAAAFAVIGGSQSKSASPVKVASEQTVETQSQEASEPAAASNVPIIYNSGFSCYSTTPGKNSSVIVNMTFSESAITDVTIDVSGETAGIGADIGNELAERILDAQSFDVDGVSGATITSNAIKRAAQANIAYAELDYNGGVRLKATNFPDAVFLQYVSDNFDTNGDGMLSVEEVLAVEKIDVSRGDDSSATYHETDTPIQSLKGIEYFILLEELDCSGQEITKLDMSGNPFLEGLFCGDNMQLKNLNVTNNTGLYVLYCPITGLTNLDVSNNAVLAGLYCYMCGSLTSLDVSNNTELTSLYCNGGSLTNLDVSNCTELTTLYCQSNQLTSLDISNNTLLTDENLSCDSNVTIIREQKETAESSSSSKAASSKENSSASSAASSHQSASSTAASSASSSRSSSRSESTAPQAPASSAPAWAASATLGADGVVTITVDSGAAGAISISAQMVYIADSTVYNLGVIGNWGTGNYRFVPTRPGNAGEYMIKFYDSNGILLTSVNVTL